MYDTKKNLIILTGPTAVGKTGLSIQLAKKIHGEIISADSMQVYRGMDIGSAKIKVSETEGITHYLIDVLNPDEPFNVCIFQKMAKQCINEIIERGNIPILVGGTGFYIQSVLYDIDFTTHEASDDIRCRLAEEYNTDNGEQLYQRLIKVDPESAQIIHPNNRKRLIRALEYFELTGCKISEHNALEHLKESAYRSCYFVLDDNREKIYERIDRRVEQMIADGLIDEVSHLKQNGYHRDMVSMQGLGYKEILSFLDGEITLEQAVYMIKRDTRHFAKRQLTWFRREKDVILLNRENYENSDEMILTKILTVLKEKGILQQ